MRVQMKIGALAIATLVAAAATANAQARGARNASMSEPRLLELGMDAGLSFGLDDPKTTSLGLPVQSIRAAFYMNPTVAIEPHAAVSYSKTDLGGGQSLSGTAMNLGVGALWHFSPSRSARQFYARPFVDLNRISGSTSDGQGGSVSQSASQFGLGAGIGVKMPFGNRMAWRFEANLTHNFDTNTLPSQTYIGLGAGLSFYTR
ncbi:MAG TPA: outer membrane beta-barrel protein [Gemmatimonadaceae bacterium]|nr:outer membrane beta-barrel protein [Gemmatimonadaceae bacterium]